MPESTNRIENPSSEIEYQEIYLTNADDFGTGALRFVAKKNSLNPPIIGSEPKTVVAMVINPPKFQIAATINTGMKLVAVRLGRADGTLLSRVLFSLPKTFDTSRSHKFETTFADWKVKSMSMDSNKLEEATGAGSK